MKLTVAQKVVLGFTIILLLLTFASISSIGILSDINRSTLQVDSQAIPIQKQSNAMQILLLKQAKLSALISTIASTTSLTKLQLQFGGLSEQLQQQNLLIKPLLSAKMLESEQAFNQAYLAYQRAVSDMFKQKNAVLSASQHVKIQQSQLDLVLEEASIILEDLSYLEDSSKQTQIDRIVGAAGQIEGYLINLTDSTKEILTLASIEKVQASKDAIDVGISNIEQQLEFLQRLGEDYDTSGMIENFVAQFAKTKQMLADSYSIFDVKIEQLTANEQLSQTFVLSEQHITVANNHIEQLQARVEQNLNALQAGVFADVEHGKNTTISILAIMLLAGAAIAFATIKAMLVPLRQINKVLSFMATGDLSKQLRVTSDDEYGVLSSNVNHVVEDLRTLIGEISENTHLLNHAAEQSSSEIAQVTQSLIQQQSKVENVTHISDQLKSSADDILSKANSAEQQMTDAIEQSKALAQIANTTNNQMTKLVTTLDQTTQVMSLLQKQAVDINSILDTIQGISDQTNLLALNAAIEAARAGESGRGFAVVADEVRLLASRTQASAQEIHVMIEALQRQTDKAASDIGVGKTQANDCQQHTDNLLRTLLLISNAIKDMHQMSQEIAASANMQNSLSGDINSHVQEVVEMSELSCQQSASTQNYSKQVAELSEKLEQSVGTFKV
jgi:methyl-accepting chemotaxis protein